MAKPMAPEEFIRRAKAVHGTDYDYSGTEYRNMQHKVRIICPKHGEFTQLPQAHLKGQGCPACGQEKYKQTMVAKYGVENPMQVKAFFDKARRTSVKKYGHEWAMSNPTVTGKRVATNVERYGGGSPTSSAEIQEKVRQTCMTRYGVPNTSLVPDAVQKCAITKAKRGTFNTSSPEDDLYEALIERFGEADVKRQYVSDEYPFACDFYVRSRKMYIELNGSWTHGCGWYDLTSDADNELVRSWSERGTKYYQNAVHVWTDADVRKRGAARNGNLNYVVFWGRTGEDIGLWFAMGCPDGRDWERMYSWLPLREIFGPGIVPELTGTSMNLSRIVKAYQFQVFYGREIRMWNDNPVFRYLPLQTWLYANRLKYLGKAPDELTDLELMRGFTISGILKGYSVFDTSLMDEFVRKYGVKSVYDPCAGWGERMLYCHCHGIEYHGVDVNLSLKAGYDLMAADFGMIDQDVAFADSGTYVPDVTADAILTCPPYGGIEKYSSAGAENLLDQDFLNWWGRVVRNSMATGARYFVFQVNQKWRDRMLDAVAANGFELIDELMPVSVKSGHFNRKDGTSNKKEFESMLVLSRK